MRSLQSILGVRWWHRVSHTELLKRSVTTPVEHLLQRQLRWLGHVIKMTENRFPRRLTAAAADIVHRLNNAMQSFLYCT